MSRFPIDPTGTVRTTGTGRELVIERTFRAPIDDVWASLTEPERVARWYGTMVGETGAGRTITITMTAEAEDFETPMHILECEPPHRFVVEGGGMGEPWHLTVELTEADGITTLVFVQPLPEDLDAAEVGPGWEFYADRLTASRDGDELPDWDADGYLAVLGPHYAAFGSPPPT